MFFKKRSEVREESGRSSLDGSDSDAPPKLTAIPGGATSTGSSSASSRPTLVKSSSNADADSLSLVLDALGGVLSTLARYPLDLPQRPAADSAQELQAWHKHAMMGVPLQAFEGETSVGIVDRDWNGVVHAVTQQRREEHRYFETAIGELREALWACVETVHKAVKIDNQADSKTESQMERARTALTRLQTGQIKQEVLGAVTAIESALKERRDQHQEQYVTLASKLDKLGQQLEEARKESTTDALTGVGNRKLFDMMVPRAVQLFSLSRTPVVLVMIDLDKLKMVNDMYGHQAGDAFISGAANALKKTFARTTDVICRYGGDEYAVILHNTEIKNAETLAKRFIEQVTSMPRLHPAMEFQVSASVGIAQLEAGEEEEDWMARADKALYKAKQSGNTRVVLADKVIPAKK